MKYFKLPDLGEGLHEAEIVRWHITAGNKVETDQIVVSVETAKAIVDVPSPQTGVIAKLFGKAGDIIHVGEPLLEFQGEQDTGTVVGEIKTAQNVQEDHFIIGSAHKDSTQPIKATPAVRALAQRLGIALNTVKGSGKNGLITTEDVEQARLAGQKLGEGEVLRGVRRAMAQNIAKAHSEVAQVTTCDDADLHAWTADNDVTMRLVRAIVAGCQAEPGLNAWYDGKTLTRRVLETIHIGIAVDTEDGLFVPVLRNVNQREADDLKQGLQRLRADVKARTIPPQELQGHTITLSNYGTIGGRYGTPLVVPPTVTILGAGKIHEQAVVVKGKLEIHKILPLSLSFDHRPITGGEATRFLNAVIKDLEKPN